MARSDATNLRESESRKSIRRPLRVEGESSSFIRHISTGTENSFEDAIDVTQRNASIDRTIDRSDQLVEQTSERTTEGGGLFVGLGEKSRSRRRLELLDDRERVGDPRQEREFTVPPYEQTPAFR